jgi:hypothetical protein
MDPAPLLDYAPGRERFYRRRSFRRVIITLILCLSAGYYGKRYEPAVVARSRLLLAQRKCARYTAPSEQIVYEEEPARAAALLRDDPNHYRALALLHSDQGNIAIRQNPTWGHYLACREGPFASTPEPAVLFLHTLRAPNGMECIVFFGYDYYAQHAARCRALTPLGWWNTARMEIGVGRITVFEDFFPTHVQPRDLRFYAGQIDAADPSHFFVPFEWAKERGRIHGWLRDDGTMLFKVTVIKS